MRNYRLQNKISESIVTLPVCVVLCFLVWLWNTLHSADGMCLSTLCIPVLATVTTLLIMETNSRNALLRIRSRMISVVWVTCIAMMAFAHHFFDGWMAAFTLATSMYLLLETYQQHEPVVTIFHSALLLGVCIISVPWTIVMIPLYWWYMLIFLRSISPRTFWASVIGLLLPLWFAIGWCIFQADFSFLVNRWNELAMPQVLNAKGYANFLDWKSGATLTLYLIVALSLLGGIHFIRTYYLDKIRTRMLLYIYVMQTICCILIICLQPRLMERMMLPLAVCCSPIIAHYFALTGKIITNMVFILTLLLTAAIITLNMGLWRL